MVSYFTCTSTPERLLISCYSKMTSRSLPVVKSIISSNYLILVSFYLSYDSMSKTWYDFSPSIIDSPEESLSHIVVENFSWFLPKGPIYVTCVTLKN